ncbi:MAG: tRNA pseudouridine(54/55) synthase Pus10 [Candidatus Helarchaeota archaeon]|nr:tRNA pseudouridine(54/55) synthase Pus10 [Candidatus Helarchaeota archaeon]
MTEETRKIVEETLLALGGQVQKVLTRYPLCNSCLGRQFALLGREITNFKRGESLKLFLTLYGSELNDLEKIEGVELLKLLAINGNFQPAIATLKNLAVAIEATKPCYICEGFMDRVDAFKDRVLQKFSEIEYRTFLVGSQIPESVIDREDSLRAEFNLKYGESIKAELNREVGKRIQEAGMVVSFETPDVVAVIDPVSQGIELKINPLFIYGRYRKLKRGISQTRWICWNCEGRGCEECKGLGLRYEFSVEVFISEPILKAAGGQDYKFHGAGREDIDARMLGTGRPFVVEIKEPKKRNIDLELLQKQINQLAQDNIEVLNLEWSDRSTIRNLKALAQVKEKSYRILVETQAEPSEETMKQADEALTNVTIQQRTPTRVLHRRADKLRMKRVYEFKTTKINPKTLEITVRCQGGCYVKELVNGDAGRTTPNLSSLLNIPLTVLELDVLDVA